MKTRILTIPISLLLLIGLSEASGYTRCYEGFNMTVGGIPFRLWKDRVCPDGKSCMIQERRALSAGGVEFAGVAIRYGGCFSRKLQNMMSCSPRKSHATENQNTEEYLLLRSTIFEIAEDFMPKLVRHSATAFATSQDYHLIDFITEDNNIDELRSGILNFLGSIGFKKEEIEIPFRDHVRALSLGRSAREAALVKLLQIITTDNDATISLSNSLLARASDDYQGDELPLNVSYPAKFITGMLYPVVNSLSSNADEVFETVSGHIKSKDSALSRNSCRATLRYLAAVQLVASAVNLGDVASTHNIIYTISNEVSRDCLAAYFEDTEVKFMMFVIDKTRDIHREFATCYGVSDGDSFCSKEYVLSMMAIPFEFHFPCYSDLPPIPEVVLYPGFYQDWCRNRKGNKSFREEFNSVKHVLEFFPNKSCREYVCHCMLCNSHAALANYHDGQVMSDLEEISDHEDMLPKSEL